MKRLLIASVVGALILYIFLFAAHVALPVHYSDYKYTAGEDSILNTLGATLKEDGLYFIPYYDPNLPHEELEAKWKERMGKPYALVNYHSSMEENFMTYLMSFVYNFMAVLILCIALAAASPRLSSFFQRLWFVLLFALFTVFSNIMMQYNWDGYPMHYLGGQIFDVLLGFFFVGIWLAWYYGRLEQKKAS